MEDKLKKSISARIDPEIKSIVLQKAEEEGVTPSRYVEMTLADKVYNNEAGIEELKKEISRLTTNNEKLTEKLQELDVELEEIEEEIEEIKPLENLQNDLDLENNSELKAQIESLSEKNKDLKTKIKKVEGERDKAAENCELLEKSVDEVTEERDEAIEARQLIEESNLTTFKFSEEQSEELNEKLDYIQGYLSAYSKEEILIASLKSAIYNSEESFFGAGLRGFLSQIED